jgi:hypothetical protein
MNKSVRIIGLCVSSLVFVALLGLDVLPAARAQPEVKCPCDFDASIPDAQGCWGGNDVGPIFGSPLDVSPSNGCQLFAADGPSDILLFDIWEDGVLGNLVKSC